MKKYLKLISKTSETEVPHFKENKKTESGYVKEYFGDYIGGKITEAKLREGEYENKKYTNFVLVLDSGMDELSVEMPHTGLTYSIINALLTTKPGEDIKIKVGKKKSDKNGKFYPTGYVNLANGDKVSWKYDIPQQPRAEKVKGADGNDLIIKGKAVYDDSKVEKFWENAFNAWVASPTVSPSSSVTASPSVPPPSDDWE